MEIQTDRLKIRKIKMSDAPYILKSTDCPLVSQMYSNGFTNIDKVKNYINVLANEYDSGKFRTLAIANKGTDNLVGSITIDIFPMFSRAELGYWINKDHRNIGYATETVKATVKYCFEVLSLNRVQAMTSNPASEQVLKKSGFLYEGTLRQYAGINDNFWDCKMFSILKSDHISS